MVDNSNVFNSVCYKISLNNIKEKNAENSCPYESCTLMTEFPFRLEFVGFRLCLYFYINLKNVKYHNEGNM